ncbi:sugar ABC transporter permease [Mesorhizobium sp. BAC0120]|uniref:carbohydrate ABC transporter permease n=1 Tax=Mesorhizobium sp. BAC0120 TaxID=3090670 RepID=UPI00298D5EEA|nr:sugar ABC transporter permease [Mesorhizobium sp. BAC0120]MDW6024213.1 sugar ABC transporter permease [Mesorhizobium sp. BAC0120]
MLDRAITRTTPYIAMLPAYAAAFVGYLGSIGWMIYISFTASKSLPKYELVGTYQYERLFQTTRWLISLENMFLIAVGVIALTLALGTLLAIALDQHVSGESVFRTIFLYPYAMSLVVTGIAWQWLLNPQHGLAAILEGIGLDFFDSNILNRPDLALWAIVIACVWQGAGLTVVIILSALRSVDNDLWRIAKVEGIPAWRMYVSVVLPMLRPAFYTASFLMLLGVVSLYELVLALTGGGPGISTEVPTKFIMDYLFQRGNIGLAAAACVTLLAIIAVCGLVFLMLRNRVALNRGLDRSAS